MTINQEINTPRASAGPQDLCLNMIVKNEVKILERCLASVAPWISYYVIGDTGSNDGTQDLIRSFFKARGIPGEIHEYEFENYSQARNLALEFCKTSEGKFNNILLIDADMEFKVDDPNVFSRLPPIGTVRQTNSELSYHNVRLLNRAVESTYLEPTHEYISSPFTALPVEGIWFYDHACGSNRSEKSSRDARLLEASILENPNNVRSMFYLAQTYKDMREWAKALAWYIKRKEAGGWDEEVWYAAYMMANCYKGLGNESKFISQCLEAYQMRPERAEPLHLLANFYRNKGKNELALIISEAGKKVPYPDDKLFVEDGVYNHGFDEEIQIAGFYCQNPERKKAGYDACMKLSVDRKAPEHVRKNALYNSRFYAKNAISLLPSFKVKELHVPCSTDFVATNPSVAMPPFRPSWFPPGTSTNSSMQEGDAIYCIVRSVNYTIENGKFISPNDIVCTENYLCELNDNLDVTLSNKIIHNTNSLTTDFPVKGREDCRLFWWKNEWWATATVRDRHPSALCEIALFNIKGDKEHVFRVAEDNVITEELTRQNQKNWMPLVLENEKLLFVYRLDPTIVLEVKESLENEYILINKHTDDPCEFDLSTLRGSSQCIAWGDKYLLVAHESFRETLPWRYLHRFVELNLNFQITRISDLFQFTHAGIEFCVGLANTHKNDGFLITFGVEDKPQDGRAFIAQVSASDVEKQLKGPEQQKKSRGGK